MIMKATYPCRPRMKMALSSCRCTESIVSSRLLATSGFQTKGRALPPPRPPRASSAAFRQYMPAGSGPAKEVLPTETLRQRSTIVRFLNPWVDLANVTDDAILAFKVESVTRTFGVVAALMCSLSAAALAVMPASVPEEDKDTDQHKLNINGSNGDVDTVGEYTSLLETLLEHIVSTEKHVAGTSLLVNHLGVPAKKLADIYSACCAASFYSSVCAMGLSAVLNAWLGCTPPGGTKHFVRYHSTMICVIPGLLAVSTGLAGVALFIGLDRSKGTPISYIGLGGTVIGGLLIGSATTRGMLCTYRLLTPLAKKI